MPPPDSRPEAGPDPMNFLILGDGPEELAWAEAIMATGAHRVVAAYPGVPGVEPGRDLDDALATAGVDAAVVGGPVESRAESVRRVAAAGLPAVCLHPPGPDSEAYYQVSMSRAETGAVLVPDLPARHSPAVVALREALDAQELGGFRGLRYEVTVPPGSGDLVREHFARAVDVVRFLIGEIEAVTATGDPPGPSPTDDLVVQLRGALSRRAEVRFRVGTAEPAELILTGSEGSLAAELPADLRSPARLTRRSGSTESEFDVDGFDPHRAVLFVLTESLSGRGAHPDLADGTRAMEVSEGVARSLRRGRTVELHYEEISEVGTFKSVMTSFGCLLLFFALVALPVSLAGPALGLGWTIYIAYAIPPVLVAFVLLQLFRFAARDASPGKSTPDA